MRFGIWFKDFALHSLDDEVAVFSTPSNLRQKILASKYKDIIKNALFEATGIEFEIEIISTETNQEIEEPTPIPQPTEEDRKEERAERRADAGIGGGTIIIGGGVAGEASSAAAVEGGTTIVGGTGSVICLM